LGNSQQVFLVVDLHVADAEVGEKQSSWAEPAGNFSEQVLALRARDVDERIGADDCIETLGRKISVHDIAVNEPGIGHVSPR